MGNLHKEPLITKKELSLQLGISVSKIDQDMAKGLPYVKLGKAVRFDISKVNKFYGIDQEDE